MAGYFKSLIETKPEDVSPQKKPGFTSYVTDIPVGVARGASLAVRELIKLGALPIDYVADTNLLSTIDNIFNLSAIVQKYITRRNRRCYVFFIYFFKSYSRYSNTK